MKSRSFGAINVLRAVLWFHPLKHPVEPVATMGQAVDELVQRFAKENLPLSADSLSALRALGGPSTRASGA